MNHVLIRSAFVLFALVCLYSGPAWAAESTLRLGAPWSPKTMDPQVDGYMFTRLGVVEGLTTLDEKLNIQPCLATAWTVSDDKLSWRFTLRDGVRFHDGTPLTAPAFRDALQRTIKKGALLKNVPMASVEAPDDKTLVFKTTSPFSPLPAYLARGEAGALAPSSFDQAGELVKPVGTGVFSVESWKLKEEITLAANKAHWGPVKPKLDKVVYKSVPDALTRLAMLRGGELDVAQIMPADAAKSLAKSNEFSIHTMPIGRCRMMAFNLSRDPFSDIRVRKAVNLAVNRQEIVEANLDGIGEPAKTLFPPQVSWANASLKGFAFDPEGAKALLAQAGWKDANGDGILDKDGKPLRVKLLTYPERAELPPMAEVIQQQLKKVGIGCDVVSMQVSAAEQTRDAGDFDLYLLGRGLLFVPDPDDNLMMDYFSENTFKKGWGAYHYKNAALDGLLQKARTTFDQGERKKMYDEVQVLLEADMPMAYLNYYVNIDLVSKKVSGYRMHPTEQTFSLETLELK
ncbi:ABC transporter substrate-binding protein [Fundidesulfovibrio putealis]|uniref:ABC transporter substrate-binding protein n=1 Tax=Fundidesulfovibrio putealis TaxID=270496 RepID=UPI0004031536|nr:ABC transporter substrate-binding protein [Fundidesulfovibrio putealis]